MCHLTGVRGKEDAALGINTLRVLTTDDSGRRIAGGERCPRQLGKNAVADQECVDFLSRAFGVGSAVRWPHGALRGRIQHWNSTSAPPPYPICPRGPVPPCLTHLIRSKARGKASICLPFSLRPRVQVLGRRGARRSQRNIPSNGVGQKPAQPSFQGGIQGLAGDERDAKPHVRQRQYWKPRGHLLGVASGHALRHSPPFFANGTRCS
jgi:hypothetical protein